MTGEARSDEAKERIVREEAERCARLTGIILPALLGIVTVEGLLSLFEPQGDPKIILLVFVPTILVLLTGMIFHRNGRSRVAAWLVSSDLFVLAGASMWFFGGLSHEIGSAYIVVIMLAAATLGSRAAVLFGGLSIVATTVVAVLEFHGIVPPSIIPLTVVSAWVSLTISIVVVSLLVHLTLKSLREALVRVSVASSERDAARIRYLQAQKMEPVGRLASGVAHDFNNLLTVMTGVSSLLRSSDRDPKFVETLLDDLDSATARATLMTGQLLAFTRNRPEEPQILDLGEVLRSMTPLLARLLGDDVRVELKIEEDGLRVRADRSQFEQVILNLAVNARDAMPEGGLLSIRLSLAAPRDRVLIEVEDNGVGMEARLLEKVFTPFFTTKQTGTGLGLATVRDIVSQYQGEIRVKSEVGRGTRFDIVFPLAELIDAPRASSPPTPEITTPGRVLLVEDHDLVRRTNRRSLEQAGYDVTAVIDGVEALSLIEGGARFDVIVTDMMMPRMNGAELALELDRRGSATPVLFVSGNFDQLPSQLHGLRYPSRFLGKPFSLGAILDAVAELLAEARPQESSRNAAG